MVSGPLVSVYLPTKGRPRLVVRAIRSVLEQDYQPLELVVVVDGPDPETAGVLAEFAHDSRVRIFYLPTSLGACGARNHAIRAAEGELITGIDDDDEFLTRHISLLVAALLDSSASFSCAAPVLYRAESRVVRHRFQGEVRLSALCRENVVGNQVMTRREHLLAIGGFDEGMPAWQDFELWIRLCKHYGSGVKIDSRTYIQHLDHEEERISNPVRIEAAYHRFVEQHAGILTERDRASLELLMFATSHQKFPLSRLVRYWRAGCGKRALSAVVSDRIPQLRPFVRKLRSL